MIPVPLLFDHDNVYVNGLTVHTGLDENTEGLIWFGTPAAASTTAFRAAIAATAGVRTLVGTAKSGTLVDAAFGRTLTVTSGAATNVTIYGRDYLNQPMTETIVCAAAATYNGLKAFKYIDAFVSSAATTVAIGSGAKFGLPFVTRTVIRELTGTTVAAAGALTAPDFNTPTASTGDVRGTYTPTTTPNGVATIGLEALFNDQTTDGLYGTKQYA